MASVYILFSKCLDSYYIGSTDNLNLRHEQHLNKEFKRSFTSRAGDWIIYLEINDLGYNQARKIELHIKRMKSRKYIENLKQYPEIIKRLIDRYG